MSEGPFSFFSRKVGYLDFYEIFPASATCLQALVNGLPFAFLTLIGGLVCLSSFVSGYVSPPAVNTYVVSGRQ